MPKRRAIPLDRLEEAAAALGALERRVLILCARDGLSFGEVAARLGIPTEAVAGHLADALYDLARELDRPRGRRRWWRFW